MIHVGVSIIIFIIIWSVSFCQRLLSFVFEFASALEFSMLTIVDLFRYSCFQFCFVCLFTSQMFFA